MLCSGVAFLSATIDSAGIECSVALEMTMWPERKSISESNAKQHVCVYYEWYGRRQWKMPLQWEKKQFPECYPPHSIQTPVIYYDYIIVQIVHTCPNKIGRCGCINDTKLFSMEICVLFVSFSVNFMSRKLDKIIIIVDRPMFSYRIGAKRWKMVCSMSM